MTFIGQIFEVPVGQGGLVGTRNQALIRPDQLTIARNVSMEGGVISKEGGAVKYNSSAISGAPTVLGGWDWWPTTSLQRMIVALSDGTLKKDSGAGSFPTTLVSSLTMANVVPVFVEGGKEAAAGNRKLFIFTGANQVKVLSGDGSTVADMGPVSAPGAATAALAGAGAGNVDNGTHSWKITFVTPTGETTGGTASNQVNVTDKTTNGQISLTAIPLGPDGTLSRKIYRTVAGDTGNYKLVGTISNNTTTTFTDNVADASLGVDAPSVNAASTRPADWTSPPAFGLSHLGRVWGGGNSNDPHRLYFSTTSDHENMIGINAGTVSVFPGEGERLVGAISFKNMIVAWKYPVGIYIIDTRDPSPANWLVGRLTNGIGGVSPLGACIIDDDVLFIDASGNFQILSTVQAFGDMQSKNLSVLTNIYSFIQDNFNLSRFGFARAVYYAAKREAHFAVSALGSTINNARFVIDFNKPEGVRFRYSERDVCEAMWTRKDVNQIQRLTIGDNAGFVWNLDQSTKSKDGAGYEATFQTAQMDFSWIDPKLATVRKIGQFLECVVEPKGNWNLSVNVFWDGVLTQTISFNMGTGGAALGSFVLGTDRLGGDQILNRKRRLVGSGRRLALSGTNSGAGEDYAISRFLLHCLVGDERLGREST